MNMPEFFKYASILSVPLFAVIALALFSLTESYSPQRHTISQTIIYLTNPVYILLFRLNFILKSVLDFCFDLYLLNYFKVSIISLPGLFLFVSAVFFGSLAYFTEASHSRVHRWLVYSSGALWAVGQILLVRFIEDRGFFLLSLLILPTPVLVGLSLQFTKKINAFMQSACVLLWYGWILVLVFKYM